MDNLRYLRDITYELRYLMAASLAVFVCIAGGFFGAGLAVINGADNWVWIPVGILICITSLAGFVVSFAIALESY